MAARTEAGALAVLVPLVLLAPASARAQGGVPDFWQLETLEFRLTLFDQRGAGYQSMAGPMAGPGSEEATVVQPLVLFRFRQAPDVHHEIVIPIDIVSAASPDAIDIVSSASRVNEAAGLDVTTTYDADPHTAYSARYGFHFEEPLRSFFLGAEYLRRLADDNATVSVSGSATFDFFDTPDRHGVDRGFTARESVNANVSFSQILSPTTLVDASYGLAYQVGTLGTTYNSVPLDGGLTRSEEILPRQRLRHAIAARLFQHIPASRTTLRGAYRFYADDFGLRAHTVELSLYQYLSTWLYVRGAYRFYVQSGVDFWATSFPMLTDPTAPRTSDSDLAPFDANQVGLKLVVLGREAPFRWLREAHLDMSYDRYLRSNDLTVDIFSLAYGRQF